MRNKNENVEGEGPVRVSSPANTKESLNCEGETMLLYIVVCVICNRSGH